MRCAHLGAAQVLHMAFGGAVQINAEALHDRHIVQCVLEGAMDIRVDEQTCHLGPGAAMVSVPRRAALLLSDRSARQYAVRIERSVLDGHAGELIGRRLRESLEFERSTRCNEIFVRSWRSFLDLDHLIAHYEHRAPQAGTAQLRRRHSEMLMELLVSGASHNYSHALVEPTAVALPRHVRTARELIGVHLSEPLPIAWLARQVGASVRSLQAGFLHSLGLVPQAYIRTRRLERLHDALLSAPCGQSVTELMTSVGIVSFGRYAAF